MFAKSLLVNCLVSLVVTLSIAWVILSILHWLNKKVPWTDAILKRLILEIITTFPVALLLGYILGIVAYYMNPYHNQGYEDFIFSFLIISAIMNFILVAISDWFYFFNRWKESLVENEKAITRNAILEKENLRSQYEVLKNQINPHFLFNSLNVLSSIIHTDPDKAEAFVDEFSELYRYILDQNKNDFVSLKEELDIGRSYMYLQGIRFSKGLDYTIEIDNHEVEGYYILPLAIQTLLENAIKHNTVQENTPLRIEIYIEDEQLNIVNNLQPRPVIGTSTGIGIPNLIHRYKHYNKVPIFEKTSAQYRCILPLLTRDDLNMKG